MTDLVELRNKITKALDYQSASAALEIIANHFGVETKTVPCKKCNGVGRVQSNLGECCCATCYGGGELIERDWSKTSL